ncbi:hypothetical protein ACFSJW_23295 [Flavobacterium artemisiae]|uniref:Uncharacterized protein n=1 Tax=Flavobacterium artemisiae TaxID=2126556 RepID=A0ABW4H7G7_9FLAO
MSRRNKPKSLKSQKQVSKIIVLKLLIFVLAVFCAFYSMRQYYNFVIIKFVYLVSVSLVSGVFFGLLIYSYEKRIGGINFKIWDHFTRCTMVFGPICCSILFLANECLSNNKEYNQTVLILEKHKEYRRSPNEVVVKIEGEKRDINLSDKDFQEISLARSIDLKLKKGFFGFILIKEVKLKY